MLRQASMRSQAMGWLRSNLQRYYHSVCSRSFTLSPAATMPMKRLMISRVGSIYGLGLLLSSINNLQTCNFTMLGLFPQMGQAVQGLKESIENQHLLKDTNVLPHFSSILAKIDHAKSPTDIVHVSNLVKQGQSLPRNKHITIQAELPIPLQGQHKTEGSFQLGNLQAQIEKLKWAGYGLPRQEVYLLSQHLRWVGEQKKATELRFWGKIFGTEKDYYILQGLRVLEPALQDLPPGSEKRGEGVNYYSFWVSTNLLNKQWTELPTIQPKHVKLARKIKVVFTGQLGRPIVSYPPFEGEESHYVHLELSQLKAQLVRMTSSLQIVPKGVFKVNEDNPKLVQLQDEPKIPEFAELTSIENWQHRNQNILHLGRCTHYIDPATPEDQIEAVTAELAEKDPEIQRLRGITEDKLPQGNSLGLENVWQARVIGDTQVFQKDEAALVYAVVVYKNVLWPGWVTIGYKGGFCSYYTGYGHKWVQPCWSQYQNANLGEEAEELAEFQEPNPKEAPKAEAEPVAEGEPITED